MVTTRKRTTRSVTSASTRVAPTGSNSPTASRRSTRKPAARASSRSPNAAARAPRATQGGGIQKKILTRKLLSNLQSIREQCYPGKPCSSKTKNEYIAEIIEFLDNSPDTNVARRLAAQLENSVKNTPTPTNVQMSQGPREAGRATGVGQGQGVSLVFGGSIVTGLIAQFFPVKLQLPSMTLNSQTTARYLRHILEYARTNIVAAGSGIGTAYRSIADPGKEMFLTILNGIVEIIAILFTGGPDKWQRIIPILEKMCSSCMRLIKIKTAKGKLMDAVRKASSVLAGALEPLRRAPRRGYENLINNNANRVIFGQTTERTLMDNAVDIYMSNKVVLCILTILSVLVLAGYMYPPVRKWAVTQYESARAATSSGLRWTGRKTGAGLRWTGRKLRNTGRAAWGMKGRAFEEFIRYQLRKS